LQEPIARGEETLSVGSFGHQLMGSSRMVLFDLTLNICFLQEFIFEPPGDILSQRRRALQIFGTKKRLAGHPLGRLDRMRIELPVCTAGCR
jgi:hypothetical protein